MKRNTALVIIAASVLLTSRVGLTLAQTTSSTPVLAVSNTSHFVGDGRYDWTVFIYGTRVTSNHVQCVEYTLHPTFPNPIRRVCVRGADPQHAFPLSSNGWGGFTIGLRVFFRDGTQQRLSYPLKLGQ
jgi:transcription initiation factor IIF auxiliary subunit